LERAGWVAVADEVAKRNEIAGWEGPPQLHSKYEPYAVHHRGDQTLYLGIQYLFKFENSFGASLIHGPFTYGLEIATLHWFYDKELEMESFDLAYIEPTPDGVLGYLNLEDIEQLLDIICALPPALARGTHELER
jgi:hypothetical protein